jgi:adenylosuccinate lyase
VLRGYAQTATENVALWHERDISHSGAERVILPDATILIDYMQHLAVRLVRGLVVDAERMRENLELTHGALFSQRLLLALVATGMERDEAYRIVQQASQRAYSERTPLRTLLEGELADEAWAAPDTAALAEVDYDAIFDYGAFTVHAEEIVARLG